MKEISAIERSNCFGVMLLILPGVLNSISVDEPQLPERFDDAESEILSRVFPPVPPQSLKYFTESIVKPRLSLRTTPSISLFKIWKIQFNYF